MTIGQRIKFFMDAEKISIRKFARALDVADTNIRNYLARDSKPSSDVVEKILRVFPRINPTWLIMGDGEPFLPQTEEPFSNYQKNISGNNVGQNTGKVTQHHGTKGDDPRILEALGAAEKEIQSLKQQLKLQEAVIAAKEETITLLRGQYRNPN